MKIIKRTDHVDSPGACGTSPSQRPEHLDSHRTPLPIASSLSCWVPSLGESGLGQGVSVTQSRHLTKSEMSSIILAAVFVMDGGSDCLLLRWPTLSQSLNSGVVLWEGDIESLWLFLQDSGVLLLSFRWESFTFKGKETASSAKAWNCPASEPTLWIWELRQLPLLPCVACAVRRAGGDRDPQELSSDRELDSRVINPFFCQRTNHFNGNEDSVLQCLKKY